MEAGPGRGRPFMERETKMVHKTQMVTWKLTQEGKRDKGSEESFTTWPSNEAEFKHQLWPKIDYLKG